MIKYNFNDSIGYLEIDPQFISEGLIFAEKEGLDSIRIRTLNQNSGQTLELDLSSFDGKTFIKRLTINDDFKSGKVISLEKIYTLINLNQLQLLQPINIDSANLQFLKSLYIKDDKKVKNLNYLKNLQELLISSTKFDDCLHLKGLEELIQLRIGGSLKSLTGIEYMPKLLGLRLTYSSKVSSIENIKLLKKLESLYIEKCKLLSDYSFLEGNQSIRNLFIDELDSLSFVPSMSNLESITFWNCKDGNLEPLLKSKSLKQINFFPNKKNYTHTIEEIIEITGAKRGVKI